MSRKATSARKSKKVTPDPVNLALTVPNVQVQRSIPALENALADGKAGRPFRGTVIEIAKQYHRENDSVLGAITRDAPHQHLTDSPPPTMTKAEAAEYLAEHLGHKRPDLSNLSKYITNGRILCVSGRVNVASLNKYILGVLDKKSPPPEHVPGKKCPHCGDTFSRPYGTKHLCRRCFSLALGVGSPVPPGGTD